MPRARGFPVVVVAAVALALVASACAQQQAGSAGGGEGGGGEDEGGTIQIAGQDANDHGSMDVTGSDEAELELDDFYFEPTVLEGEAGQTLTVELENEGDATHTFTVDELGVDEEVQPGDRGEAEVTFPDSGALLFYCRFHQGGGMRGALSVGGDLSVASGS
jgi:plastocyanin